MINYSDALNNYLENSNDFNSDVFYITPNNSKIEMIYEDETLVLGVIRESKLKSQIGNLNNFVRQELKTI